MPNDTDPSTGSRRAAVYRGAFLAVLLQWTLRLVGLVSVVITARLLSPRDFGMIGLAMTALALVELLGALGLRQALLRVHEPQRDHLDTAWTIQLILFWLTGLGAIAIAPLAASFYDQPILFPVIATLSLRFFFLGFVNVGIVDFDRNLDFGRDLRMRLISRLCAFAVTLGAAILLRNFWALVIGMVTQSAFHAAASYLAHPYRPRLSLARRTELLGVSFWIFISASAQTVQQQFASLAVGRFGTPYLVGLFSASRDISEIFTQEIATALNRVTFVTVAQSRQALSHNPGRIAEMIGAYAMIAAPMALGLAATAEATVRVLLGEQWTEAAPLLQVIAAYSGLYAVYKVIASALQASGHARRVAFMSGGGAALFAIGITAVSLVSPDALSVAWMGLAANLVLLAASTLIIARMAQASLWQFAASIFRPFAAAMLMFLCVRMLLLDSGYPIVDLAAEVAVGAISYPIFVFLIWRLWGSPPSAEREAWQLAGRLGNTLLRSIGNSRRLPR